MPDDYFLTPGYGLRALKGDNAISEVDEGFKQLALDVEAKMAGFSVDTEAKKPAAGIGTRFFRGSDSGLLWHDTGAGWVPVLGPGVAGYSTGTTRAAATPFVASETRHALMQLEYLCVGGGSEKITMARCTVKVGGKSIGTHSTASNGISTVPGLISGIFLPAGVAWEYSLAEAGAGPVTSRYALL